MVCINYFHKSLISILLLVCTSFSYADTIDSLESALYSQKQVQEKIYIQLDNTCYYKGDTLWYKVYTLCADNLMPTNISRLLYIELITPDGYLVERQHVVIDKFGESNGMFILFDSLYSGYYELRAYTKWNLNYNVVHKRYSTYDREWFYNRQLAKDYFRIFEGLYSRVFPIYEKPHTKGDYQTKHIISRPKRRIKKDKDNVKVSFFPEGGNIIDGISNRIAFEITDQHGKGLQTECVLGNKTIRTNELGRSCTILPPILNNEELRLTYKGKEYRFKLPEPIKNGASIRFDALRKEANITYKNIRPAAYAILCRGKLELFQRIIDKSEFHISLKNLKLPTGVNEILIFDSKARILCSRQFFINNHDVGCNLNIALYNKNGIEIESNTSIMPYERVSIQARNIDRNLRTICISVRDTKTDDSTYDTRNILTDLLLCGDLKGFVANPQYYFESDDSVHTLNLDLLMMIQGWRKYKQPEYFRYKPEKTLTFEGRVSEFVDSNRVIHTGFSVAGAFGSTYHEPHSKGNLSEHKGFPVYTPLDVTRFHENYVITDIFSNAIAENTLSDPHKKREKEKIIVEAEIIKDKDIAGGTTTVDEYGRFAFQIPPFYGKAILFVTAYNRKDSISKCISSHADSEKGILHASPDYYVHRDMFFPIFTKPYSWYQTNYSDSNIFSISENYDSINNYLKGNQDLPNVVIKGHRRKSLHAFEKEKPAMVWDMYDLYNECADRGISYSGPGLGGYIPSEIARCLFGNMDSTEEIRVRTEGEGHYCFLNYQNPKRDYGRSVSQYEYGKLMDFRRVKDIKIYTDYDLRNGTGKEENKYSPDVHMEFIYLPDESKRPTCRDRRYILDGVAYPEEFYNPDYSETTPKEPIDYRRTLYWNPNAILNTEGNFSDHFYGKSEECRVNITATGISNNGNIFFTE